MDEQALCYTDIGTLGRLYHTRAISPAEATRAVLDRIRRLDQRLNSFITVLEQPALEHTSSAPAGFGSTHQPLNRFRIPIVPVIGATQRGPPLSKSSSRFHHVAP